MIAEKFQLPDFHRHWIWKDENIRSLRVSIAGGFPSRTRCCRFSPRDFCAGAVCRQPFPPPTKSIELQSKELCRQLQQLDCLIILAGAGDFSAGYPSEVMPVAE